MLFFFLFIILIIILLVYIFRKAIFLVKSDIFYDDYPLLTELKLQLKNLDVEYKKNEIDEDEYKSVKFEIEKRILRELKNIDEKKISKSYSSYNFNKIFLPFSIAVVFITTGLLYWQLGNYNIKDKPFDDIKFVSDELTQSRLNQINAEILTEQKDINLPENNQLRELVNQLKEILKNRPNDLKGYNLLVENSARIGDFQTAHKAFKHIIENINNTVNASDYSKLAELMIAASDGYVSIEAENNLIKSLHLDGSNKRARYYFGLLKLQKNELEEGYEIWKNLLTEESDESPWSILINQDIARLENLIASNNNFRSSKQIKKPTDLSEDELDMIYGMVSNLNDRIENEGGSFDDWFKLIRSYLVLGENELAIERFNKAKDIFKKDNELIRQLENLIKDFNN